MVFLMLRISWKKFTFKFPSPNRKQLNLGQALLEPTSYWVCSTSLLVTVSWLKEIVQKLESLVSLKDVLLLNVNHGFNAGSRMLILPSFPSMESSMYGRNDDQTTLSNWLKSQDKELSVISMVGMGGIGKTTLAQHLYIDPMIVERFDVRAWVHVSEDFDVCRITRVILQSITGSVIETTTDQIVLQEKLKEQLTGKKFFVVLDNVWIEDEETWGHFETPFSYGAQGSKILFTTRSGEVASVIASDRIHQLHQLDEEDSWTLFAKHAFEGFDDSQITTWHEEIGKKVADKCKGLPLALIAIGNLLCRNSSLLQWEKISESDAWDLAEGTRIVPALMVSYQNLPTHLKKCFEYCALFPKGYLYEKDHLCLLWMAENLIQCPRQHKKSMKEVAESYFNDLILRSFFQPSTKYKNYFVMHDLLHDLSKSIFGEFCFTWEDKKAKNITSITCHFSFLCDELGSPKALETLYNAKKLRTFLPLSMTSYEYRWLLCLNSNKLVLSEFFSKCKRLRVLSLCGCFDMIELPDTISNLKHLHHLDLSRTRISKLPDTLCSLHYLQTLKVRDCEFLEELPMNLHKLVNLCYLDFSGTKVSNCENCILLPSLGAMSSLKHLRITGLSGIVVIGREFYRDGRSSTVSIPFPSLETLTFKDMNGWGKWEFEVVGDVFPRLKRLSIVRCPNLKDKLPETLECLVSLKICDCKQLVTSVPFSPAISELRLNNCGKLKFNYHLSTLKFLDIRQCYIEGSSVDWIGHTSSECGTNIKSLKIEDCPTMHIPLCGCYNFLVKLDITSSCDSLTTFPLNLFPNLDFLDLYKCSSFEMISQENEHLKLISLSIEECPKFASFPKGGLSTPRLQHFNISKLKNLKSLPECMHVLLPSIDKLSIDDCPQLESFSDGGLPSSLRNLFLVKCSKLLINSLKWALPTNTSLSNMYIQELDVESFPNQGLLPLSLTYLKQLDYKGLENLPSLRTLSLNRCPNIQCLPKEGLPKSISTLQILGNCSLLKQRCKKPNGEDYRKISQIECVMIDNYTSSDV